MKVKIHTTEQIISKLREVERLQAGGQSIAEACKQIAVSEHTFYKWRKRYGTMQPDEAKRLKDLERENGQLKKLVADLSLDNLMLKEVAQGKF
ncbi:MAG: transposase [Pyrinomonadaceae bacterium MAG19_C2-C3]|nr:transposase [Pyrinomonadaceae bacterium MAG19_C2-C3]